MEFLCYFKHNPSLVGNKVRPSCNAGLGDLSARDLDKSQAKEIFLLLSDGEHECSKMMMFIAFFKIEILLFLKVFEI